MNGNDPIGCGFGAGRASELLRSAVSTSGAGSIVILTSWGKRWCHFFCDRCSESSVAVFSQAVSVNTAMDTRPAPRRNSTCPNVATQTFFFHPIVADRLLHATPPLMR